METHTHKQKYGGLFTVREAAPDDARDLLDYIHQIASESEFLTFGPGEFELTEVDEADFLRQCRSADNQLYLLGLIDGTIVATLHFAAGRRPRVRHSGEFGMSVRKDHWGCGIGSLMLDTLIDWSRSAGIIKKLNLRVRTDHARAIRLYERKGFTREGTLRREIFLNGTYYDHHWMGLKL